MFIIINRVAFAEKLPILSRTTVVKKIELEILKSKERKLKIKKKTSGKEEREEYKEKFETLR